MDHKNRKTWREKLDEIQEKIHTITPEWEGRYGKGKILIASARDIEKIVRKTKSGQLLTQGTIREILTKERNVRTTDPITIGIFMRIIAETAEEERKSKRDIITPYWRVLKPDGSINIKFPGGMDKQVSLLRAEGHIIETGKSKKSAKISNYEDFVPDLH